MRVEETKGPSKLRYDIRSDIEDDNNTVKVKGARRNVPTYIKGQLKKTKPTLKDRNYGGYEWGGPLEKTAKKAVENHGKEELRVLIRE